MRHGDQFHGLQLTRRVQNGEPKLSAGFSQIEHTFSHGADVEPADARGNTPLHYATRMGHAVRHANESPPLTERLPKYADFVEAEVLPRVETEAEVIVTKDPDGRMTLGGSSGGAVAFTMAWFHPELYHRVLTYSGTYVNLKSGPDAPHGAWEYNEHFIPQSPAKPLRVWMEVAQRDNGATTSAAGLHNWIIANINMAAALKTKGYHYQFVYAKDAGHTDGKVISQTLPQALEYLWRGYPSGPPK